MSATLNLSGGLEKPYCVLPTDTSRTDIYTSTKATRAKLVCLSIVNADSSARVVTIEWYNGSAYKIIWRKSIPADDTASVIDVPVSFKTDGEKLCATCAAGNVISITAFIAIDTSAMGQGSAA